MMHALVVLPYLIYAQVVPPNAPPPEQIAPMAPMADDPLSRRLVDPNYKIAPSPPPVRKGVKSGENPPPSNER